MSDLKQKFKNCKTALKIVIVGNSGTGKTSFCNRWMKDKFIDDYKATIMSDFSYKIYEYKGNYYKIQFWDIGGQDKNIYATKVFSKGAHGCLIVSDITIPETLDKAILWKKAIEENTKFIDGNPIPILLIQNKIDLVEQEDLKNDDDIKKFTEENKFIHYFRTSCKEGININESMDYLLSIIIQRMNEYSKVNNITFDDDNRVSIVNENPLAQTQLFLARRNNCCQFF
jgi:small GTP-binding protein